METLTSWAVLLSIPFLVLTIRTFFRVMKKIRGPGIKEEKSRRRLVAYDVLWCLLGTAALASVGAAPLYTKVTGWWALLYAFLGFVFVPTVLFLFYVRLRDKIIASVDKAYTQFVARCDEGSVWENI